MVFSSWFVLSRGSSDLNNKNVVVVFFHQRCMVFNRCSNKNTYSLCATVKGQSYCFQQRSAPVLPEYMTLLSCKLDIQSSNKVTTRDADNMNVVPIFCLNSDMDSFKRDALLSFKESCCFISFDRAHTK